MDAVWVLNLDADLELGARGPYTATRSVLEAMRGHRDALARTLLAPGEDVLDGPAKGRPGRAFCPTPRAIALLEQAGAIPEPHPPVSVLREVNGRAFCARLGPTLPDAAFVTDLDDALARLGARPMRVKRAWGMAGRGQRVVPEGPLAPGDRDFVRAGVEQGGVMIEPDVAIELEVAIHGMLARDGSFALGRVVRQRCDARGVWIATEPLDEPFAHRATLEEEARRVAAALHAAGYFGPFGIDAYVHAGGFQPRSEINARYSMGFPIGMPNFRDFLPRAGSEIR